MSKLSRLTEPAMARIPAIAPQRETQIHASTTVEDIVANSGDYSVARAQSKRRATRKRRSSVTLNSDGNYTTTRWTTDVTSAISARCDGGP
jgi:hypothetical protein